MLATARLTYPQDARMTSRRHTVRFSLVLGCLLTLSVAAVAADPPIFEKAVLETSRDKLKMAAQNLRSLGVECEERLENGRPDEVVNEPVRHDKRAMRFAVAPWLDDE